MSTTTFAQIKFGPEAGFNMALQNRKTMAELPGQTATESSVPAPGFSLGVMLDIKVLKSFYIQGGTGYFFNNIKYTHETDLAAFGLGDIRSEQYDRVHQLRFPLFLMYKSGLEGMGRFMAGVGPYGAWSFKGSRIRQDPRVYYNATVNAYGYTMRSSDTDIRFGNEATNDLRSWDMGLNGCIGYESNVGLYFRGTFNYGLLDQNPLRQDDLRIHNWGFGLSIGYLFGKDSW